MDRKNVIATISNTSTSFSIDNSNNHSDDSSNSNNNSNNNALTTSGNIFGHLAPPPQSHSGVKEMDPLQFEKMRTASLKKTPVNCLAQVLENPIPTVFTPASLNQGFGVSGTQVNAPSLKPDFKDFSHYEVSPKKPHPPAVYRLCPSLELRQYTERQCSILLVLLFITALSTFITN